jgi:hypothetical protein
MSRRGWLVVVLAAAMVGCSGGGGAAPSPGGSQPSAGQTGGTTGPRGGLAAATLDLTAGAANLRVASGDLGSDLYRVSSDGGSAPQVSLRGSTLTVQNISGSNQPPPRHLDVELSKDVRWTLHLNGGASTEDVNVAQTRVDAVSLAAGANQMSLELGVPHGTVKVEVTGGANRLTVRVPVGSSASVHLAGAVNSVTINGSTKRQVSGGADYSVGPPGADRYQIDVLAGLNTFTLTQG